MRQGLNKLLGLLALWQAAALNASPLHHSYSQPFSAIPLASQLEFALGRSFFKQPWVAEPATTSARDGLGPLFNASSCASCHVRNGRGRSPSDGFVVRLARSDDFYGDQLQDKSLPGLSPEVSISIRYAAKPVTLGDGTVVVLQKPMYEFRQWANGRPANLSVSARLAPPIFGLGLLQAIPFAQIASRADPDDVNRDGISGRLPVLDDGRLGRFGWKAGQVTLQDQIEQAFFNDMGLTSSSIAALECGAKQQACRQLAKRHNGIEVSDKAVAAVVSYLQSLAVPKRRNTQAQRVRQGEALFDQIACSACHQKHYTTGASGASWLAAKNITPYSDFLLHDMGPALADARQEGAAQGNEWRTPPLWGIGLATEVAGAGYYLHDGRARTLLEAVLWHGGEAEAAKQQVMALSKTQRQALLAFLRSL